MIKIETMFGKAKRKLYLTAKKHKNKEQYIHAIELAKENIEQKLKSAPKPAAPEIKRSEKMTDDDVNTIECLKSRYCSGCGACRNVCPSDAISMEMNEEGFFEPVIDKEKCTCCGLCKKRCPSLNTVYENNPEPECYAAYAVESIRKKSSSGGIFTVLAQHILDSGGYVCGAAYDGEFKVRHIIVSSKQELEQLRKSKYVQSDTGMVFREIKKLLSDGKSVLFCGCGCQVAGLYAALADCDHEKLYTVDLMCHGGPSPGLFAKYLEEHYEPEKLDYVGFREKDYFGWSTEMTVSYKDGTVLRNTRVTDPYYKAFLPCISVREYCGSCAFAKLPRQADITLADFWGVEKYNPEFTDGGGTSLVSVNNEKGLKLWNKIKPELVLCEQIPLKYALATGQPFNKPFKSHPHRKMYFEYIKNGASMEKAYDYATKRKFDVGIYGVWPGCNYGSVATYYALHEIIKSFGLTVLMIDRLQLSPNAQTPYTHARRFAEEHYEISKQYTFKTIKALNNNVDTFIIGSDQVWNRGVNKPYGMTYYLDFADNTKKKIAYASSFGHDSDFADAADRTTISNYMKRFDAVSLREDSGVKICKEVYGVDAEHVLDPVFAADRNVFDKLAEKSAAKSKENGKEKFLLAYILDPTPEKKKAIEGLCEKLKLRPVVILDGQPKPFEENKQKMALDDYLAENVQVEDWLYYIKNSEFVLTDSCHGVSFAIVFDRPFIGIANAKRGTSRFDSLLNLFNLKSRYVTDAGKILGNSKLLQSIDYDSVHKILEREKAKSLDWLKNALFSPKEISSYCAYPVVDKRLRSDENG